MMQPTHFASSSRRESSINTLFGRKKEGKEEGIEGDRGMYSNIEQQQSQKDSVTALCILIVVQGIFSLWPVLIVIALQGK